jgi:hypothetical protein
MAAAMDGWLAPTSPLRKPDLARPRIMGAPAFGGLFCRSAFRRLIGEAGARDEASVHSGGSS